MKYSDQHFRRDSQHLYNHFCNIRKRESPSRQIERFRSLFIDGVDYPELAVLAALRRIVNSPWAEREFKLVLNRCCYILINYWWLQSHWWLDSTFKQATIELVALLQQSSTFPCHYTSVQRLRELVQQFTATEQYTLLQRRAWLAEHQANHSRQQTIGSLIYRYPFLYRHYLMDWDSSEIGHQAIHQLQTEQENQFDQSLFRYTTHLLRQTNLARKTQAENEIPNPTLLSARHLESAIKYYAGKGNSSQTYRDSARQFVDVGIQSRSYRDMKSQLYTYLTDSIAPEYGNHSFNRWLEQRLHDTLPQREMLSPSPYLLVQTCRHLLDVLIVNPYHHLEDHVRIFVDLITNLQPIETIGLMLKIALVCTCAMPTSAEAIKSYLSQRFSAVFRYYERRMHGEIEWLIECLENLMVALSLHFGQVKYFSWVTLL